MGATGGRVAGRWGRWCRGRAGRKAMELWARSQPAQMSQPSCAVCRVRAGSRAWASGRRRRKVAAGAPRHATARLQPRVAGSQQSPGPVLMLWQIQSHEPCRCCLQTDRRALACKPSNDGDGAAATFTSERAGRAGAEAARQGVGCFAVLTRQQLTVLPLECCIAWGCTTIDGRSAGTAGGAATRFKISGEHVRRRKSSQCGERSCCSVWWPSWAPCPQAQNSVKPSGSEQCRLATVAPRRAPTIV